VHNTYFTLPVVFAMLSIHYAPAHAHADSWLVLLLFMSAGALIRQFFVLWHSGGRAWWLLAAGAAILLVTFAWLAPKPSPAPPVSAASGESHTAAPLTIPSTAEIQPILHARCAQCHAAQPTLMASAPLGAILETVEQIEAQADKVHLQTVVLKIMPPGNLTQLTDAERAAIDRWHVGRQSAP